MITIVDHINIVVSDLERSVAFYREVLGMRETKRAYLEGDWIEAIVGIRGVKADVVFMQPVDGGPRIELLKYHAPEGVAFPEHGQPNTLGLRHIAFQVKDMDAIVSRLEAAGVTLVGPPTAVPGGVVKHDAGRKRLCYFHDPDGVLLELAEYT